MGPFHKGNKTSAPVMSSSLSGKESRLGLCQGGCTLKWVSISVSSLCIASRTDSNAIWCNSLLAAFFCEFQMPSRGYRRLGRRRGHINTKKEMKQIIHCQECRDGFKTFLDII